MSKTIYAIAFVLCLLASVSQVQAVTYSTGCVRDYTPNGCPGPDLPATIPEGANFRFWYNLGGHNLFSSWNNGNVWGSDFRDAGNGDLEPQGGSDVPQVYLYAGHGICQNPPNAASPDFIVTCGNFGTPDNTVIGSSSRWGNGAGNLRFAFIDASCPMDLVSLTNQWFPAFRGLHMAVGHSGTSTQDALDSAVRGTGLAAFTSGAWFMPNLSVGDAWMTVGIDDVQNGCCAVVIAAGNNRNDAINRRENERVTDGMSDPTPNWFAWRWICR
jgi:hypothetical protein